MSNNFNNNNNVFLSNVNKYVKKNIKYWTQYSPDLVRIAVVRVDKTSPFFLAFYFSSKNCGIIPKSINFNGMILEIKYFLIQNSNTATATATTFLQNTNQVNTIIEKYSSEIFKRTNVYSITACVNYGITYIVINVFHKDVLFNDDNPLPQMLDNIPVIVRDEFVIIKIE